MFGKFMAYAPHFQRQATPEEAINDVRSVWENASIEKGHGGAFRSHLGNKQWLWSTDMLDAAFDFEEISFIIGEFRTLSGKSSSDELVGCYERLAEGIYRSCKYSKLKHKLFINLAY